MVLSVAFRPNGEEIASASANRTVKFWPPQQNSWVSFGSGKAPSV
jgi:WD40 repeat protein